MEVLRVTYVLVKSIDLSLDGSASPVQSFLDLLAGFCEGFEQDIVDSLRTLGIQDTLGSKEVLDNQVEIALTSTQLKRKCLISYV